MSELIIKENPNALEFIDKSYERYVELCELVIEEE